MQTRAPLSPRTLFDADTLDDSIFPLVSPLRDAVFGARPALLDAPAGTPTLELPGPARTLACDAIDTGGGLELRFDVPGVAADDIAITVDGTLLNIAAARAVPAGTALSTERPAGLCVRSFTVDSRYDLDLLSAYLHHGELVISIPRTFGSVDARRVVVAAGPPPLPSWAGGPDEVEDLQYFSRADDEPLAAAFVT